MKFDPRAAAALQPDQRLLMDGYPGLRLEASKTRKTWVYRYENTEGRMKQIKIGNYPMMDHHKAIGLWQAHREKRDSGIDIVAEVRAVKAAAAVPQMSTVQSLVEWFLDNHVALNYKGEQTRNAARAAMMMPLEDSPEFAQCPPDAVSRAMAFHLIGKYLYHPEKARRLKGLFAQTWDQAHDAGLLSTDTPNWWREVMRGKIKSKGKIMGGEHQGKVHRALALQELNTLLPWCLANMHPNGQDGTMLYLWTGMRGVELFGMRPEYVSQEDDGWWMTYPVGLLKTADQVDTVDHRVPLVGRALDIVRRRMQRPTESGYLFESARGGRFFQYTQKTFSTYAYNLMPYSSKVLKRASEGLVSPVIKWSPHDLRRTARTTLSRLRCPVQIAEAFIGHKPPGIIGVYDLHTFDQEKREWSLKLADYMEAALGVRP